MVATTASISLKAVDTNVISTLNDVSAKLTNATLATTALSFAFAGLEKAARTNQAQMLLGANSASKLAKSLSSVATVNSKVTKSLGVIGNYVLVGQQMAILSTGADKARRELQRIPQALQAMQASGVSTRTVEEFINLSQAIKGSDQALESFLVNSISELGRFEAAAARAGTILKSSFRISEAGTPERADATERLQNAVTVQKLVNDELNNSVSSSQALLGQYEVLSAGFTSAADSQKVLTSGLKLIGIAEAGGVSASPTETLQLLTKTLNAYELSADEAAKTSATLNAIVENGLTTIPQLSLGFGATAKQAKSANIGLVDLGASVSVLTAQGVSTPEALTGISRLSANILNKTPEAEKALAKLQLRGEKIRFDKAEIQAKGFVQALVDLNEAAGGSSEVLSKILPEDVAFRTASALLAEQGQRLVNTKNAIGSSTATDLEDVFEIAQSDRTKRFERIANRFREIIIKIGLSLADTIEPGLSALEVIADRFANLPEFVKKAIGGFLAFRIASKSVNSAIMTLIKTLATLATNYLSVRLISLALSGQLGNEFKTIKALITQRKGLGAATLQLFGINQKWRLDTEKTTAAIKEQGRIATAVSKATTKAGQVAGNAATAGVAKISGVTVEQAKTEMKSLANQALATAQNLARQGKAIAVKGLEKIGLVSPATPVSAFVAPAPQAASYVPPLIPAAPQIVAPLIPAAPQIVAPLVPPPAPIFSAAPLQATKPQPIQPLQIVPLNQAEVKAVVAQSQTTIKQELANLVSKDQKVVTARQQKELAIAETKQNLQARNLTKSNIAKAKVTQQKAELALIEAKNKAIAAGNDINLTSIDREKAINEVTKKQQKLKEANLFLADQELEYQKLNTQKLVQQNRTIEASNKLDTARATAAAKYQPLAAALTRQENLRADAILQSQKVTILQYEAEQIATATSYESKAAIDARNKARIAENQLTRTNIALKKQEAAVTTLSTALTEKERLAEMGLYKVKVFGKDQVLTSVGLLGKINKLMTISIGLKLAEAAANVKLAFSEASLNKARAFFSEPTDLRAWAQWSSIARLNVNSLAKSIKGGLFKSTKAAASGFASLLGNFKIFAPLLGAGAVAAIVLRNELFGLGAATRKLSKTYKEYLEGQKKLNAELGRSSGLFSLSKLAESDRDGFKDKLAELRDQGSITDDEFAKLAKSIQGVGDSGKQSKKQLSDLRKELKQLELSGKRKIDKSPTDYLVDGVKAIPGLIGQAVDFTVNTTIGRIGSNLRTLPTQGRFTTLEEIYQEREISQLIKPLSQLDAYLEDTSELYLKTTKASNDYLKSLALTPEVQKKIARGEKLTAIDLKQEKLKLKELERDNNQQIQDLDTRIAEDKKALAKVKNLENKAIYESQINAAELARTELQEKNDQLKQTGSDVTKYITEELPKIKGALKERSNPLLALSNAQSKFDQTYLKDGEGRTTALLKPLQTLRDESFKLASQVQENLSLGLISEEEASKRLRAIRDNKIEFVEDGKTRREYRLTLADRRSFTEQTIALDNADFKRKEDLVNLELQKIRNLSSFKLETEINTNIKISELQAQQLDKRIAQKQKEIQELSNLGLKTTKQELELKQLEAQLEPQGLRERLNLLNKDIEKVETKLSSLQLRSQKTIQSSRVIVQDLAQENQFIQANSSYLQQQISSREKMASLQSNITKDAVFNAKNQLNTIYQRNQVLKATIPYQKTIFENEIKTTQEQNKQKEIQAQLRVEQASLSLYKAEEQFYFAQSNQASRDRLKQLQEEIDKKQLTLEQAKEDYNQSLFLVANQDELNRRKREQLTIQQQQSKYSAEVALGQAQLAITEAEITKQLNLRSVSANNLKNQINLEAEQRSSMLNYRTGELSLAAKLTKNEKDKLKIARSIANLKLRSLTSQIRNEEAILRINQSQERANLSAQKAKNQAALSQNLADILKAQAEVDKLKSSGASDKEVNAAKLYFDAQLAQRASLQFQGSNLEQQEKLNKLSQEQARRAFNRKSRLDIDQARVDAIEYLPKSQQESAIRSITNQLLRRGGAKGDSYNDLIGSLGGNNLSQLINRLGSFKIENAPINIPQVQFPNIEKIRADVASIVAEFKTDAPQQKRLNVQTINMDSPITININGEDKEEIAQEVETAIFNRIGGVIREVENELNEVSSD